MPPKKSSKRPARAASPRRRAASPGNVGAVAGQHFGQLVKECKQSAQRVCETSQGSTVRHQTEVRRLLGLLQQMEDARPLALPPRSAKTPARAPSPKA